MPVEVLDIFQKSYLILCRILLLRLHSILIPNEKEAVFINYHGEISVNGFNGLMSNGNLKGATV